MCYEFLSYTNTELNNADVRSTRLADGCLQKENDQKQQLI